ncbi:uncharacterized protein LOC143228017 [Tachypleus tridentatus]|uniref:uncharacterized protein LOC143228017 n=1 Tax=Tachypleus tridentatus TaxID=6853 RepID=UPI003FCFF6EE
MAFHSRITSIYLNEENEKNEPARSSIYQTFRTILRFCRIFGGSCVEGLAESGPENAYAKRCSFVTIYAVIIWLLMLSGCCVTILHTLESDVYSPFTNFINSSAIVLMGLGSFGFAMVSWYKGPDCVSILKQILVLERELGLSSANETKIKRFSKMYLILFYLFLPFITVLCVTVAGYSYMEYRNLLHTLFGFASFLFLLAWGEHYILYVLYFAVVFIGLFDSLNSQVEEMLDKVGKIDLLEMQRFKKLHSSLSSIMKETDRLLSPGIFIYFSNGTIFCCIWGSMLNGSLNIISRLFVLFLLTNSFVGMFMMTSYSECLGKKVRRIFRIVEGTSPGNLPLSYMQQMPLSVLMTSNGEVHFTASGFFKINSALMTTITGAIFTYTVILIQNREL